MIHSHSWQFRVEPVESTPYSIMIKVTINDVKLDKDSTIVLNIYEQNNEHDKENLKKIGNVYLKHPFKEYYTFEDLSPLTSYKMNFFLTANHETYHSTIFAKTKNDPKNPKKSKPAPVGKDSKGTLEKKKTVFSQTENLLHKYTEAKSKNLPIYRDDKDLKKNILDARSAKEWKEYQSSGFKFARPKQNFEQRKKRVWLVASGFEVFDQMAGIVNRDKGFNVMEGDWFMGPFYSHDNSYKKKVL